MFALALAQFRFPLLGLDPETASPLGLLGGTHGAIRLARRIAGSYLASLDRTLQTSGFVFKRTHLFFALDQRLVQRFMAAVFEDLLAAFGFAAQAVGFDSAVLFAALAAQGRRAIQIGPVTRSFRRRSRGKSRKGKGRKKGQAEKG